MKINRQLFIATITLFVSACATAPGSQFSAIATPVPGYGDVYLYRTSALFAYGQAFEVFVDGEKKDNLYNASYLHFRLKPGSYQFKVAPGFLQKTSELKIQTEANTTKFFQYYFDSGPFANTFFIGSMIKPVDNAQVLSDLKGLKAASLSATVNEGNQTSQPVADRPVQPEKPVVAAKPVAPEKPVVLEKIMVLEKKARVESVAGKLEVVTLNNAASADIVALNKQLSSSMVKALRNTCLQEVNGLPTTRKAAPQTTDAAYVLVVKPEANQDAPAHAKLTMALHQLSSQYPSPVAENGVWKAAVTMKVDAAANKEKIREVATGMVKLMDDDKLFEASCLN